MHGRPPPRLAVYAYPWALGDMRVERALDELAGLGVDGIQLALSYHVASVVTPRNPRRKVFAGDLGSVWFDYEASAPGPWNVRPTVFRDSADAVPLVLRAAAERGIQVVAWLVYLYSHDLAGRYPWLAVRNAFGDSHPAQLCPSQPDVREYALNLTSAALAPAAHGDAITGLHAESLSFLPWGYGLLGLKSTVRLDPATARLLGLCFCGACRERARGAGLDVERLAVAVRTQVEEAMTRAVPQAYAPLEAARAYEELLAEATASLNREVAERAVARGLRFSSTAAEVVEERADHLATRLVRPLVDEVRVKVGPAATADELRAQRAAALAACRPGTSVFAQYQLHGFEACESLVEAVEAASAAGLEHHRFYEHSVSTEEHLAWIRRARAALGEAPR